MFSIDLLHTLIRNVATDLFLGMANRVRGGGLPMWGTQISRLYWGCCCGLTWAIHHPDYWMWGAWVIIAGAVGQIVVGHSAYQGMWLAKPVNTAGKDHEWITRWLPSYSDQRPTWQNVCIAYVGMGCVGAVRAALIFAPLCWIDIKLLLAVPVVAVALPAAYLFGQIGPFPEGLTAYRDAQGNLKAVGNDKILWCEMLAGIAYGMGFGATK